MWSAPGPRPVTARHIPKTSGTGGESDRTRSVPPDENRCQLQRPVGTGCSPQWTLPLLFETELFQGNGVTDDPGDTAHWFIDNSLRQ
jgi:hypothetical protein